jgi:hypothetical protein
MLFELGWSRPCLMGCTGFAVVCALVCTSYGNAQTRPTPTGECRTAYDGFATSPGDKIEIGEVTERGAVQLEVCGSAKGCVEAPVAQGTPIQIYRQQGAWTCGYVSGHNGAGPAWVASDALRIVPHDEHPSPSAWVGIWSGGEDRVRIRLADKAGALHLAGSAVWHGAYTSHLGHTRGIASPIGNRLHFVENGPGSCTINLVLLNRYILAEDNQACGVLNVRFQGIWKRTSTVTA